MISAAKTIARISSRRLTLAYLTALLIIAGLAIGSHLIFATALAQHRDAARIINVSGRQRMLAQRIAGLAAQYALGDPTALPPLRAATDEFAAQEARLSAMAHADSANSPSSRQLRALYFGGPGALDTTTRRYIADARAVAALPPHAPAAAAPLARLFAAARTPLLGALDQVVTIHQRESEDQLASLQSLQMALTMILLAALALEALTIFRPMIRHIAASTAALTRLATLDPLTELMNRRSFLERCEVERLRAARYHRPQSILMLDADHFKTINDSHGHEAGDQVLRAIAQTLRTIPRATDIAARIGGEEFALLLPETSLASAALLAERLRADIAAATHQIGDRAVRVTVSIGVAAVPDKPDGIALALAEADRLMYQAKNAGRNRIATAAPTPDLLAAT
jgi:diguanylate cyclase (GGDEF)-like protein